MIVDTGCHAAEILDHIKAALDKGVEPGSAKYTALAERIKLLRDRIIQNSQDALEFLSEALRVARAIVEAESTPTKPSSCWMTTTLVSCRGSSMTTHRPASQSRRGTWPRRSTKVVTHTLAQSWDNADARNRGVRRATAVVFRRYMLKPVGEPYDSTVAYIEAHYLVD
ncbi:hypothetical protein ABZS94_26050 [Streptomyces sp. NPDC005500]|uniref:hypothetical protein n=1 Tax=Streptomyces sp. NPDC005500 TaxID=3155007 RepID=UPI0033ACDD04